LPVSREDEFPWFVAGITDGGQNGHAGPRASKRDGTLEHTTKNNILLSLQDSMSGTKYQEGESRYE